MDILVMYMTRHGTEESFDSGFGKSIKFDIDLLSGFNSVFLQNFAFRKSHRNFFGMCNFSIIPRIKNDLDVVVIHGWNSLTSVLAMLSCVLFKKKFYLRSDSNALDLSTDINFRKTIKRALKNFFIVPILKKCEKVLVIGKRNIEYYDSLGIHSSKFYYVPFGVDNQFFATSSANKKLIRIKVRNSMGIADERPVYLFSGKLTLFKGVSDLVKAFSEFSGGHLIIVGDGPDRETLERESKGHKNIHFVGFKNQTEIVDYYQAADFIVLPSRFEPWGLCINEGLAAGAIPITSDICGCAPELVNTTSNLIFESKNVTSLIKVLESSRLSLGDSELKKKILSISKAHDVRMSAAAIQRLFADLK